jgi:hypothetical protein
VPADVFSREQADDAVAQAARFVDYAGSLVR